MQPGQVQSASSGLATSPAAVQPASSGLATSPAGTAVGRLDEPEAQAAVGRQEKPEALEGQQAMRPATHAGKLQSFRVPLSMVESPYSKRKQQAPVRKAIGNGDGLLARMRSASSVPPRPKSSLFTLGHGGGLLARLRARCGVTTPPPLLAEGPWAVVGLRDSLAAGAG